METCNFSLNKETRALLANAIEAYPDMFHIHNDLNVYPCFRMEIDKHQIWITGFNDYPVGTEFYHASQLPLKIVHYRDELREQERERESEAPSHVPDYIKEEMAKASLQWVNSAEGTTSVTFTIQATHIARTFERLKGLNDETKAKHFEHIMHKLDSSNVLALARYLEQDKDFPVTFTHTFKNP
jgi:hypothetical protein